MDNRLIAGNILTLDCPDGFHIMTGEEFSKLNVYGGENGEGMSDPDRHIIVTVGNENAEGFSYEYEAQGTGMYGESYVIKHGKTLLFIHFYARTQLKAESLEVWNKILASAEWR